MIHTPQCDKHRGTLRTMDVLAEHKFDPAHCVMDHNTEERVWLFRNDTELNKINIL